jgi:RNA polymerase sigma-70 factor, ECF subfamily
LGADARDEVERLFRRYGKGVGSYVLTRVGDPELAEEITARVFLIVVRRYAQVRGSEAAWLWAVVRSELARHYRGLRPHRPPSDEIADQAASPDEALLRRESHERLSSALDRLPEPQQRLVYLKFFLGMRNLDIAAACGLTPSNVGVVLHRALKQLRAWLEPPLTGPVRSEPDERTTR